MNQKTGLLIFFSVIGMGSIVFLGTSVPNDMADSLNRKTVNLWNWRFKKEEDAGWRHVSIPHDWSIEGEYSLDHESDWQSGYLPAGIGWYEKEVDLEAADLRERRVIIEFEGVYQNSTLYVNDQLIGNRPNGYVSFLYDITDALHPDENRFLVKVDHSKPLSGRWYTGSGIYRPVHLHFVHRTHVAMWSPYIYTESIQGEEAIVKANYMGGFRWTAFDYLGETNKWPSRFANFGIIDLCGFPKDHYYLYQSLWSEKPSLHLLPHWTHPGKEGVNIPVVAYTNCDSVELSINGKTLGTKIYEGEQLVWQVPYEKGSVKAYAYLNGKVTRTKEVSTASEPHHIEYKMYRSKNLKGDDIYQLELSIVDSNNVLVPQADNLLSFTLNGATWLGTENGDPLDLTAPRSMKRRSFRGKAFCVYRAIPNEKPLLEVKSENLVTLKIGFGEI